MQNIINEHAETDTLQQQNNDILQDGNLLLSESDPYLSESDFLIDPSSSCDDLTNLENDIPPNNVNTNDDLLSGSLCSLTNNSLISERGTFSAQQISGSITSYESPSPQQTIIKRLPRDYACTQASCDLSDGYSEEDFLDSSDRRFVVSDSFSSSLPPNEGFQFYRNIDVLIDRKTFHENHPSSHSSQLIERSSSDFLDDGD